jgi:cytochrome c oxidase subunit 4
MGVPVPAVVLDSVIWKDGRMDPTRERMTPHIVPIATYLKVFAALFVLLIVTVLAAQVHMGVLNTPVAMIIAVAKAVLIVLVFMHVRYANPLVRIFAAAGFFWLIILFALTFSDVLTRW